MSQTQITKCRDFSCNCRIDAVLGSLQIDSILEKCRSPTKLPREDLFLVIFSVFVKGRRVSLHRDHGTYLRRAHFTSVHDSFVLETFEKKYSHVEDYSLRITKVQGMDSIQILNAKYACMVHNNYQDAIEEPSDDERDDPKADQNDDDSHYIDASVNTVSKAEYKSHPQFGTIYAEDSEKERRSEEDRTPFPVLSPLCVQDDTEIIYSSSEEEQMPPASLSPLHLLDDIEIIASSSEEETQDPHTFIGPVEEISIPVLKDVNDSIFNWYDYMPADGSHLGRYETRFSAKRKNYCEKKKRMQKKKK